MYAIIKTGGKQYKVKKGDVIDVELIESSEDGKVRFSEVFFLSDGKEVKVGAPCVQGCEVIGELEGQVKGPKVISFKYKRRKNYHRKIGHRQNYSRIKITSINI